MALAFLFPASVIQLRVGKEAKNQRGKVLRLIQDPFKRRGVLKKSRPLVKANSWQPRFPDFSSINAVSFSSARATKRLPDVASDSTKVGW